MGYYPELKRVPQAAQLLLTETYAAVLPSIASRFLDPKRFLEVPTTWLVGAADPIADPARSKAIAANVPGADYHELTGLKHEVFNETTRGSVFAEVTRVLATA